MKVRRPDILEKVRLDRAILLFAGAHGRALVPSLRLVSLEGAVATFCDAVEGRSTSERGARTTSLRRELRGRPDIDFPRLRPEACSDAVLTMEFVEGVHERSSKPHGIDVPRIVDAGDARRLPDDLPPRLRPRRPPSGEPPLSPPGRVVLLDLGLVGELEDADRLTAPQLLYSFATGRRRTVARLFYDTAPHGDARLRRLRARMARSSTPVHKRPRERSARARDRPHLRHPAPPSHPARTPHDDGEPGAHDGGRLGQAPRAEPRCGRRSRAAVPGRGARHSASAAG